ncbi:protein LNK2-like isoform X2 [Populus alba x Populus x berolinensis]|nr:protein LNK2-like isoform X2 [Populus alba x Populus x berolinensis]
MKKLTNIIWGEAEDSDDHIVPYPEASEDYCKKKESSEEASTIKSSEQKAPGAKVDGRKLESISNVDTSEGTSSLGLDMDRWPNLSSHNAAKTEQDSLETSISNNLTEMTKLDSSAGHLDKDTEIFQNPHEGEEQGDFVDYGWASIGSFDDLDRIFSNDDPILGNVNVGNADELWSSSKCTTNSPTDLAVVGKNTAANSQLTEENGASPNELANKFCDQTYRQKKILKGREKLEEKGELKSYQDFYGNWTSSGIPACQLKDHLEPQIMQSSPPSILSQQKQLQGSEQLQYQQISNPFVAPSAYGRADLEVEDLSTLASFDPNSPIEQDDSNTFSLAVNDYSMEDTVLCRLQDIISKLDVRIRLCIRDSLFRLAQSAMQRHYASDTGSTNNSSRDEQVAAKEETSSQRRVVKMPEVETETNPVDRTVAHLLFHRPMDIPGKHPDTPESPFSTKLPCEHKTWA